MCKSGIGSLQHFDQFAQNRLKPGTVPMACIGCTDAGNGALGKALQLLTGAVILWLSIPLIQALIELLSEMLGEV